ncbi:MAG: LysM peptidoglycan-binding domain-containing protein [Lachnospiraceae bacterium]|nr:LysM peptidoglycan-binding domain-containing protein [Lachnospiraceae bacterium]
MHKIAIASKLAYRFYTYLLLQHTLQSSFTKFYNVFLYFNTAHPKKQTHIPKICSKNLLTNKCLVVIIKKTNVRKEILLMKKKVFYGFGILVVCFMIFMMGHKLFSGNQQVQASGGVTVYKNITIEEGDTLWSIAKTYGENYTGSTRSYVNTLLEINNLSSDEVQAGESLIIPIHTGAQ